MKEPGVYILESLKSRRYYIGSTDNVMGRLRQHNAGVVAATKNIRPLNLITFIPCGSLTEARQAEYRLKCYKRRDILKKIIQDRTFPWDYKKNQGR